MHSVKAAADSPPRFSDERRQDLLRAKLTSDQIRTIEEDALPLVRAHLLELDRTDEVKRWLRRFGHAARQPGVEFDSLLSQASRIDAPLSLIGAVRRLALADYNLAREAGGAFDPGFTGADGLERLARTREEPDRLRHVIGRALADAPLQRRRTAGVDAVRQLYWVTAPMGIPLSSSPGGTFRHIAHYCFEAARPDLFSDPAGAGPERAIKQLIRQEKLEQQASR